MDFKNTLEELREKYQRLQAEKKRHSEANTDAFFIRPFLRGLGYDLGNPDQVDAQYSADPYDIKTGKVDYALLQNQRPIIFVEGKKLDEPLDDHVKQVKRYFNNVKEVDFAILTNGNEFRFYTDLDDKNMLDEKPFLVFRLEDDVDQEIVIHLEQFSSQGYKSAKLKALAHEISLRDKIFAFLNEQSLNPSDEFVRSISNIIFGTTKREVRDSVEKALPGVFSRLSNPTNSPPPLPPSSPPGEQNIFQIREQETSDKKLEYFRFQNQIFHGYNWTNMFVHVLRCLCQLDSSKLMQASRKSQGFKISDNPKSVNSTNRAIKSIGNGLFTSANNSTPQKIRYLKIALEIFDMKNDLSVKFS